MRLSLLVPAASVLAASLAAHAAPVTFTLTGSFSGTLGTSAFTNDPGTFTYVTDSTATSALGAGFFLNQGGTGSVSLAGLTTAVFLNSSFGALGEAESAGFTDTATDFNVGLLDPALGDYALTFPFSDTAFFVDGFTGTTGPEPTSLGDLTITGGDFGSTTDPSVTFTAVGTTPEPSSVALLGTGVLGALGVARRRRSLQA